MGKTDVNLEVQREILEENQIPGAMPAYINNKFWSSTKDWSDLLEDSDFCILVYEPGGADLLRPQEASEFYKETVNELDDRYGIESYQFVSNIEEEGYTGYDLVVSTDFISPAERAQYRLKFYFQDE